MSFVTFLQFFVQFCAEYYQKCLRLFCRRQKTLAIVCSLCYNTFTVLGGELAVPCCLQSATVGLNGVGGILCGKQEFARDVDIKVLCNVTLRTVSGWEHSSTKQHARVPRGSFEVVTCKDTVSA